MEARVKTMWFGQALLPGGWAESVRIGIVGGRIAAIERGSEAQVEDARYATAVPGLPNLHSHAFQRLMAGQAEAPSGPNKDDFWGWRELMYRLVGGLTPDDVAAIAAMAFVEMLEAGFTRVGEFHYLHHQPDGTRYADPAEMSVAIARAASETGIGLTLLPVFYAHSGFGGTQPSMGQRRFVSDLDGFARLHEASRGAVAGLAGAVVGIAPHSLRAVTPQELLVLESMAPKAPIHIHIAEQVKEVADCVVWSGQRPSELAAVAASDAVIGLCPITEANLGDGIFPADAYRGAFGIGTDSNVRIDATEELRLLEYSQRLALRRRTVLTADTGSCGRTLMDSALAGGGQALGCPSGLVVGASADLVALSDDPLSDGDRVLDRWIFAGDGPKVDAVWRSGVQLVSDGRHRARDHISAQYAKVARRLLH
jgi:formimidoylglutamate deiminase